MSASKNADSITPEQGEVRSRVKPSEPLTTKGHAVGTMVGNDAKPEFHAETHPPGTAPKADTHLPNPVNEIPGQADNPAMKDSAKTSALDSIPGATSGTVHNETEHGHPEEKQEARRRPQT